MKLRQVVSGRPCILIAFSEDVNFAEMRFTISSGYQRIIRPVRHGSRSTEPVFKGFFDVDRSGMFEILDLFHACDI